MKRPALALTALLLTLPATAQQGELTAQRAEGLGMKVSLSSAIALNDKSTVRRQRILLTDPAAPAKLSTAHGADVIYGTARSSAGYEYIMDWAIEAKQPIVAFEMRTAVFDVFGKLLTTLTASEVADVPAGSTFSKTSTWRILREVEAATAHTSVSFLARARTADGKVYALPMAQLVATLRREGLIATDAELQQRDGLSK